MVPSRRPFFPVSAPKMVPNLMIFGTENGSQREVAYFWPTCRIYCKMNLNLMIFHVRKPQKTTKISTKSRSERGSDKKRLWIPIFHDFWWILDTPGASEIGQGAPRNRQKSLRTLSWKKQPQTFFDFFAKKTVTKCKKGLRGPPGPNFHLIFVDFRQILDRFLLPFRRSKWDTTLQRLVPHTSQAEPRLPHVPGKCRSTSSVSRHNLPGIPLGYGDLAERFKFAVPHRGTGRFINPTRTEAFFPAFAGWSVALGPCAFRRPRSPGCPGAPLAIFGRPGAKFWRFFPAKKATKNRPIFWYPPGSRFFRFRLPKWYQN